MWEEEDVEVRMCPEIGSEEWELGRREVGLRAHMHMVTCTHGVLVHRERGGVPVHTPGQDMHHADTSFYLTIHKVCTYSDVY